MHRTSDTAPRCQIQRLAHDPQDVPAFSPLLLDLDPIVPMRARLGTPWFGYRLRLPDGGPRVADGDELLALHGAAVREIDVLEKDEEALQDDAFRPGSELLLIEEPTGQDPDAIGVWDATGTRRCGELDYELSRRVMAAADHGVELLAVVLSERRTTDGEDRRATVRVVVAPAAYVRLGEAPGYPVVAPRRPARRRLILVASQCGDLRFWDAAPTGGPLELDELPLSCDFVRRFHAAGRLLSDQADAVDARLDGDDAEERWNEWMDTDETEDDLHALWVMARTELGARFLVGYQEPGVASRSWTPEGEETDPSFDDIPF